MSLFQTKTVKDKENKKEKKKEKDTNKKISLFVDWMIAFQNLLYPMLIMVPNPIYFLVLVFISKIVEIRIFMKHSD